MGKVANRRMCVLGTQRLSSGHFTELSEVLLSQGGRESGRERERERERLRVMSSLTLLSLHKIIQRGIAGERNPRTKLWRNDTESETPKHSWTILFHCQFVLHKSNMDWLGIEPGPAR